MRTTIDIDDHLLDAVRDLARLRRCTNGEVVSDLLRQALLGERVASTGAPMSSTAVVNRIRQQLLGI
jgi:Arc/MetJ family transcription regulator